MLVTTCGEPPSRQATGTLRAGQRRTLRAGRRRAHHALAHALYAQGKVSEGLELVERYHRWWEGCSPFMKVRRAQTHVDPRLLDAQGVPELWVVV